MFCSIQSIQNWNFLIGGVVPGGTIYNLNLSKALIKKVWAHRLERLLWRKVSLYNGLAQRCPVHTVLWVSTVSQYKWHWKWGREIFLPFSLPFHLTNKSRDRKFMLRLYAQFMVVAATSGQLPANLLAALCCLWWDSVSQPWQRLEGGLDKYME